MNINVYAGLQKIAFGKPVAPPDLQRVRAIKERPLNPYADRYESRAAEILGNDADGNDRPGLDWAHGKRYNDNKDYLYSTYKPTSEEAEMGLPFSFRDAASKDPVKFKEFIDNSVRLSADSDFMKHLRDYESFERGRAYLNALERHRTGLVGEAPKVWVHPEDVDTQNEWNAMPKWFQKRFNSIEDYRKAYVAATDVAGDAKPGLITGDDVYNEWNRNHGKHAE